MNNPKSVFCILTMFLAGCATMQRSDSCGECPSSYSVRRAAAEMVEQVLTDPCMEKSYKEASADAKKRGHKLPTLLIRRPTSLDDNIPTEQMFRQLQDAFRKTKMFTIVDYTAIDISDDTGEPDIGIEPGGPDNIGTYTGKDLLADSQIICEDGSWFLNMQMRNGRKQLVLTGSVEIKK